MDPPPQLESVVFPLGLWNCSKVAGVTTAIRGLGGSIYRPAGIGFGDGQCPLNVINEVAITDVIDKGRLPSNRDIGGEISRDGLWGAVPSRKGSGFKIEPRNRKARGLVNATYPGDGDVGRVVVGKPHRHRAGGSRPIRRK